jgi:methionine-rich copper-binding protein CopC
MESTSKIVARQIASRLSLVLSALFFVIALAPGVASAHAKIASSTPANGASVPEGTTQLMLTFTEEVSVDQTTAQLAGPGGTDVSGVSAAVDRAERTKLSITTPALQPGQYTIKWAAVTEDDNGHSNGEIAFTVAGSSSGSTSSSGTGSTSGSSSSLPTTGAGDGWVVMALALAGGALFLAAGFALRRRTA